MKRWTIEEIYILKNNYVALSHQELMHLLLNRTWHAIENKASKLKLTINKKIWTPGQRFWKYVDKKENNQCWNWIGYCNTDGYGKIRINGKLIFTHRFSWEIHFGKIPKDLCVLHTCDNPPCVNPSHLFLGTQQDNIRDRDIKGRQANNQGENNGGHKLTIEQVKQIRILKNKFKLKEIAKMFNVKITAISDIHRNKSWKHI